MSISAKKEALRGRVRVARRGRTVATDAVASEKLVGAVLGEPEWAMARAVAAFVGVRGEPDTRPLLEAALESGKTLWLPRVLDAKGGITELVLVDNLDELQPAPFGLQEPARRPGQRTAAALTADLGLDLVLVPGLAFTSDGARLGNGPGHYDRLLAPVRDELQPRRIGLCFAQFFEGRFKPVPTDKHDVPMHAVVTDRGITDCG
jgi:5-formyltetrahydrofolate cyclo-ligase